MNGTKINTTKGVVDYPGELEALLGGAVRKRDLTTADVKDLIRWSRLRFVVANVGHPLEVVPLADCYDFWKKEARRRIHDGQEDACLEDFEGGYFYYAMEWDDGSDVPLVLLFMYH